MRYFVDTYQWARRDDVEVFYFERSTRHGR